MIYAVGCILYRGCILYAVELLMFARLHGLPFCERAIIQQYLYLSHIPLCNILCLYTHPYHAQHSLLPTVAKSSHRDFASFGGKKKDER